MRTKAKPFIRMLKNKFSAIKNNRLRGTVVFCGVIFVLFIFGFCIIYLFSSYPYIMMPKRLCQRFFSIIFYIIFSYVENILYSVSIDLANTRCTITTCTLLISGIRFSFHELAVKMATKKELLYLLYLTRLSIGRYFL